LVLPWRARRGRLAQVRTQELAIVAHEDGTKPTTSGLTIDLPNVRGERGKA